MELNPKNYKQSFAGKRDPSCIIHYLQYKKKKMPLRIKGPSRTVWTALLKGKTHKNH